MYRNLSTGAIGIKGLSLHQQIDLAAKTGFAGIDFNIREAKELADKNGVATVKAMFQNAGVIPGQWGLPVAWNKDEQWQQDLQQLPALAALGRELGCDRTATWVPSGSNERLYAANFDWHVERFRPIAKVLADNGIRLGLEFLGPKTIRARFKYPFAYTLDEIMELGRAIGTGNIGLLLDAWHLYAGGGTAADLDKVTARDIVTVHVNDAPENTPMDELIDNNRRLPMETGVIDLVAFMKKLQQMKYDGPITPEPFSARVNAISDPTKAATLVAEYMDKLFRASGLG